MRFQAYDDKIKFRSLIETWQVERQYKMERNPAQFPFMRPPDPESNYDVGDMVEVFCDHEKNGQRIRGWLKGIVVQVDIKMVAVQFRTNVFLTDGWMVPDHILWYPQNSQHIRKPLRKPGRLSQDQLKGELENKVDVE